MGRSILFHFRQYHLYHKHIAPELIDGVVRFFTDIFSLGMLFLGVSKKECSKTADVTLNVELTSVAKTCVDVSPEKRPSVSDLQKKIMQILKLCH